jgi:hypothetical protein
MTEATRRRRMRRITVLDVDAIVNAALVVRR